MATRPLSPSRPTERVARGGRAGFPAGSPLPGIVTPVLVYTLEPRATLVRNHRIRLETGPVLEHTATASTPEGPRERPFCSMSPRDPRHPGPDGAQARPCWRDAGGRIPDLEGLRIKREVQGRTELTQGEHLASDREGRSLLEWPAGRSQGGSSHDGARTSMPNWSRCPLSGTLPWVCCAGRRETVPLKWSHDKAHGGTAVMVAADPQTRWPRAPLPSPPRTRLRSVA